MLLPLLPFVALLLPLAASSNIAASGSSLQATIQTSWKVAYNQLNISKSSDIFRYTSSSSGSGIDDLVAGRVLFAGSDALPSGIRPAVAADLIALPGLGASIAIAYNLNELNGTSTLNSGIILSREAIVAIYDGTVTMWNDAMIASLNPLVNLPAELIRVVVRSDSSGTTTAFTTFLSSVSATYRANHGIESRPSWTWLSNTTTIYTSGAGVTNKVIGVPYTIAILSYADAVAEEIPFFRIINKNGDVTNPDEQASGRALAFANGNYINSAEIDAAAPDAYPIATFTYFILNKKVAQFFPPDIVRASLRYLHWTYTNDYARRLAGRNHYVLVDEKSRDFALEQLMTFTSGSVQFQGLGKCDGEDLCKNGGSCSEISPFTPRAITCNCPILYQNNAVADCSLLAEATHIDYDEPIVGFILFMVAVALLYTIAVAVMLISRSNHPLIKAMSPVFCLMVLLGCTISYSAVFLFIGKPTAFACAARPFWLSLSFGLVFGMLTAKNYRIYSIFVNIRAQQSLSNLSLLTRFGSIICGVELLLSIIWAAASPLKPTITLNAGKNVVVSCASSNAAVSSTILWLLFVFNGLLLLGSIFIAFQTRHAGERFNESKELSVALYATILPLVVGLGLAFLPAMDYHSVFLFTSLMLVICPMCISVVMFGPKLYQLYISPLLKKEKKYDMASSIFARAQTAESGAAGKNAGDMSQSGLNFWQISMRKKRIGSVWYVCTLVIIPELNWIVAIDDMNITQGKAFESFKLTECSLVDDTNPDAITLKHSSGEYSIESKMKDAIPRFKKIFARVQAIAAEGQNAQKSSTSHSSSMVDN